MVDEFNLSQNEWNRLRPVLRKQAIDSGMSAGEADRAIDALDDPAVRNRVLNENAPKRDPEPDSNGTVALLPTLAMGAACLAFIGIKKVVDKVTDALK